jgi:hypothetical protein
MILFEPATAFNFKYVDNYLLNSDIFLLFINKYLFIFAL